jgi:phosphatidate cytidylyltransferase
MAAEPNGTPAPQRKMSNLALRFVTAGIVVPVLLWLLYWAPIEGFLGLVFFAAVVSASELAGMMLPGRRALQAYAIAATAGTLAIVYFAPAAVPFAPFVMGLCAVGFLVAIATPEPIPTAANRMAWLVVIPLYAGVLLAPTALLHRLPHGGDWVVLSMMLAWFGDTGGYFAGRALGKHKLHPKVSPKKTIEGSFGGLAGSTVGALSAHFFYFPELPLLDGVILALVAGALGQAGDLTISLIKRSADVKDSGFIVPGHGGLLDRIDGLVMTSLVTWLYAAFLFAR